jgi:hypothetical protein
MIFGKALVHGAPCGVHHMAVTRVVGRSFTVAALDGRQGIVRTDNSTLAWLIVDIGP